MIKLQYLFCLLMGHAYIDDEDAGHRRCMYCGKLDERVPNRVSVSAHRHYR